MILLIGGYPKGYDIPFHPKTRSGKILRKILKENEIKARLLNLWKNEKEEASAIISKKILNTIEDYRKTHHIIALGRHQEKAMIKHKIKCIYLPHPASWQPNDRMKLIEGLINLNRKDC